MACFVSSAHAGALQDQSVVCSQIRADIRRQINDARVPDLVTSWARERADTPSTKAAATAAKVSVARGPSAAAYGAQQSRISGDSDAMNATVNILDLLLASRCRGYRGIHSKDVLIIHRRKSKPFDTHHAACPKPRDGSAVRDAYAALLQPPGSPRFTELHYSRDWARSGVAPNVWAPCGPGGKSSANRAHGYRVYRSGAQMRKGGGRCGGRTLRSSAMRAPATGPRPSVSISPTTCTHSQQ